MAKFVNLDECHIRLATPSDTDGLMAIARGIWSGSDYLPQVLPRWLAEPYFFVCEYQAQIVACIKLSLFPDSVLWFEGLRVKKSFQGHGIGSLMNREMFRFAETLKLKNPNLKFEFCTYYKNVESLHLTKKVGFTAVQQFFTLDKNGIKQQATPKFVNDYDLSLFKLYPDYIPCGWQSVHHCPEALAFIKSRAIVFETPQAQYLQAGVAEKNIILLSPPPQNMKAELPYFQSFYPPRKRYGLIVPIGYKKHLKHLHECGFRFWEKEPKLTPNMLILAKV
ncbi:MAG: GNAT family N-acetyltransferase [Candidatus Cloacimonas sp.]|jgi:GNAT superfamily N-acetyltransferase|nr:GNAT family N-acetyltransferase [Candidatus Cloacimonas sp.]